MRKLTSLIAVLAITLSITSCSNTSNSSVSEQESVQTAEAQSGTAAQETTAAREPTETGAAAGNDTGNTSMTPEDIVSRLTLEQKAAQMVQPAVYNVTADDMKANDYGSILSTVGCIDSDSWRELVDGFQRAAVASEAGIPYIYGQDDVHGVNYCLNAVYFPHNIGQGAANDEELAYQVGLITADEAKLCHMLWNFSPCVARSVDPRWGRTYESYGSDIETITKLGTAYTKGLIDGGLVACAKHYFGDGNVVYGTGERDDIFMIIDRGDARLDDDEINELLNVYRSLIDAGVQTVMISHSSLNGVKMHENKEYIMKLKDEMGFKGFIVSDWGSIQHITGGSYREQVIKSINAGIDMLMETDRFDEAKQIIIEAVGSGDISEERVNDAVTRIIRVKKEAGLFDDPLCEKLETKQKETGSPEYRKVAEKLVEESLVLLKNENDVLPIAEGKKVYITGPAADNGQAQCGGWTMGWNGAPSKDVPGVTTICEAFQRYAGDYGIEVITDKEEADKADVVLLCVGEQSYAEWNGDTEDLELCGDLGLSGNKKAIKEARELGKPTVACIVAGRQVIIDEDDYAGWDSVVMCYLPGSEGKGISDVLCGCADFTGRLPSPWYGDIGQIGTDSSWLGKGYGLSYADGFKPKNEPGAVSDTAAAVADPALEGTHYTAGLFKDGVYVNDYADLKINVPGSLQSFPPTTREEKEASIAELTDENDIARERSQVMDACFAAQNEAVMVFFINSKIGFPDNAGITEESALDSYKEWIDSRIKANGISAKWKNREKVRLGNGEFLRDTVYYGDSNAFDCFYVRKLDDDLFCGIYVTTSEQGRTPEYYEAMFS